MTQWGESRKRAAKPSPLLTPRITGVATWNIRTIYEAGRTIKIARYMNKIGVLGLSETRWLQTGQLRL
jgi:hypothetical protein